MEDTRKSFDVSWKIKNFTFGVNSRQNVCSSVFFAHPMYQTKWSLVLLTKTSDLGDCLACSLKREFDHLGPEQVEFDYEFSFIASDFSIIHSELFLKRSFSRGYIDRSCTFIAKKEVLTDERKLFIPYDSLTVRCQMWKSHGTIFQSIRCSAETRIRIEHRTFEVVFEKFSSLKSSRKMVRSIEKTFPCYYVNLTCDGGNLAVEISTIHRLEAIYKFKIFMLDAFCNKVMCDHRFVYERSPFRIPVTFSKKFIVENREMYLPNDELTFYCEVYFTSVSQCSRNIDVINEVSYEYDYEDFPEVRSRTDRKLNYEEHHTKDLKTLNDDLFSMFKEGILCDTKLKTATKTFEAHRVVLSARSSVFQAMFATDMKERTQGAVEIKDLDADTVRKMLLFMYSDTLNSLNHESAINLYFAADMYNMMSLRHKCSTFLKQNIQISNCCAVLLLADRHQDIDLKNFVQKFILENDGRVVLSNEWKNLESSHSHLTTEIFRSIYMKNRKT